MSDVTVQEILQRAILCEAQNRRLYEELAHAFRKESDVAQFFRDYAEDETFHLALLTSLRDQLTDEQRQSVAPGPLVDAVAGLERHLQQDLREGVLTLADAYDTAQELEGHELLPAFQLVASQLLPEEQRDHWLNIQIDEHLERLSLFGERYRAERRRQIPIAD